MSDTAAPLVRPGASADPLAAARAKLKAALNALKEDQERAAAVEEARERARRRGWELSTQVEQIAAELQAAIDDEPQRQAYAYVNSDTTASPVEACEGRLAAVQSDLDRINGITHALDSELEGLQRRLANRNYALHEALAAVVVTSPAFAQLFEELDCAWAHLRGIKKACLEIQTALKGHMPREYERKWQDSIPLDPTVRWPHGPIPTDEAPAAAWATALAALIENPETPLPGSET